MSWVSGTAAFTNGSAAVTSPGADWVAAAVAPGDAVFAPDGRAYAVDAVTGAASLTLARPYAGTTVAAGAYDIAPLQQRNRALAAAITQLVVEFESVLDKAGAGRFEDGTAATPGVTFDANRNTGFYRPAANVVGIAAGGAQVAWALPAGLAVGPGLGHLGGAAAPRVHVLESDARAGIGVRSHRSESGTPIRGLSTVLLQGSGANGAYEGNVSLRYWHNDHHNLSGRLAIHTRNDSNNDGERLSIDHHEMRASVQHRPFAGTWASGSVYSKYLPTPGEWVTLAILPKAPVGVQKAVHFRLQVHVDENGGICPFELAGYFYDRSNVLPYPDILNMVAAKPFGDMQGAAALTQFRLTTLGVTNGTAYLQAMNPTFAVGVTVLSIWNNAGLSNINWQ